LFPRAAAAAAPGLGALLSYERSGLIRRVVPLSEDVPAGLTGGETPMLASLAAASFSRHADDPNAGVSLVELYRDQDIQMLEQELRRDPAIESVSRVPVRYLQVRPATKRAAASKTHAAAKRTPARKAESGASIALAPPLVSSLWNLTRIRWDQARRDPHFRDAAGVRVAVLDTGLDMGHPDRPLTVGGYEFSHPANAAPSSDRDIIGHGTHVAGTIAARINNAIGINGICNCELWAFKIFDDQPDWFSQQGYFAYFVNPVMYQRALSRCLTLGVKVVNLSIGGGGAPSANEQLLFSKLIQAGVTVVAAMGNEASSRPSYPAAIPGVIAVGASSINDSRASFSNIGGHITLVAPGQGIWSTLPTYPGNMGYYPRNMFPPQPDFSRPMPRDIDYASWDGTSMATPHVTAAVALLLADKGNMASGDVRQKLRKAAVKVSRMQGQDFTPEYGFGRLDLLKLLN
jgi:subtilisin family serine protease